MRSQSISAVAVGLGVALLATTAATPSARAACSKLDCGSNSPYLSEFAFHELNFDGEPNHEGLVVAGLESPLVWWTQLYPHVEAYRLTAVDSHGQEWLHGAALVGSKIMIVTSEPEPRKFELSIDAVYTGFDLWVDPAGEYLESYKLGWVKAGVAMDHRPLCTLPPPQLIGDGQEWYPDPDGTILYTGDRYDAASKTVIAHDLEKTAGWVNVVCPGGAGYKLFETRHTLVTSNLTHDASADEDQAMLKMYVSDVCGTGDSYTKQGTPLHWQNQPGWGYLSGNEPVTEAWWDRDGAICLNVHRLGATYQQELAERCPLPSCDELDIKAATRWPEKDWVVSRLPDKP